MEPSEINLLKKFIEYLDLSQPGVNRHKFEHIYLRRAPFNSSHSDKKASKTGNGLQTCK